MKAFKIVQWNQAHETAESRKYKSLSWVATPNKHDGVGYRQIARSPMRESLFAGWNLMLQVASKGPPGLRGWLVRDGRALTADDLSLMTGFRKSTFEKSFEFFSSPAIGWIIQEEFAVTPGDSSGTAVLQNRTEQNLTEVEKKKGAAVASSIQFAALNAQIAALESRRAELSPEEREMLREKKRALAVVQDNQSKGKF